MKLFIASDHGGYNLKQELKEYLNNLGHTVEDLGAHTLDPSDDYSDFVIPLAQKVAQNPQSLGVAIGRSGNGEAMAANKVKGIRTALATNQEMAKKAKEHNNANILSLGADYINSDQAKEIVKAFLDTSFSADERHIRRLGKIAAYEEKQ